MPFEASWDEKSDSKARLCACTPSPCMNAVSRKNQHVLHLQHGIKLLSGAPFKGYTPSPKALQLDKGSFCHAFFHVPETKEADTPERCLLKERGQQLCPLDCDCGSLKGTVAIARLQILLGGAWADLFVARYSNCPAEPKREPLPIGVIPKHAEGFMVDDLRLKEAISGIGQSCTSDQSRSARLVLYITKQPCHFSTNQGGFTCTERLLDFSREFLAPKGIGLQIRASTIYRAHWDYSDELLKFFPGQIEQATKGDLFRSFMAIIGIKKLIQKPEGSPMECPVTLCGLTPEDWSYLLSESSDKIRKDFEGHEKMIISRQDWAARAKLDAFNNKWLQLFRQEVEDIEDDEEVTSAVKWGSRSDEVPGVLEDVLRVVMLVAARITHPALEFVKGGDKETSLLLSGSHESSSCKWRGGR